MTTKIFPIHFKAQAAAVTTTSRIPPIPARLSLIMLLDLQTPALSSMVLHLIKAVRLRQVVIMINQIFQVELSGKATMTILKRLRNNFRKNFVDLRGQLRRRRPGRARTIVK